MSSLALVFNDSIHIDVTNDIMFPLGRNSPFFQGQAFIGYTCNPSLSTVISGIQKIILFAPFPLVYLRCSQRLGAILIHVSPAHDARLPSDSGLKQLRFTDLRFLALAPVHPRCSRRLGAIGWFTLSLQKIRGLRMPLGTRRPLCLFVWLRHRQDSIPREMRYFLTISATLKVMASSNSRRSSPVSFLIFSRR